MQAVDGVAREYGWAVNYEDPPPACNQIQISAIENTNSTEAKDDLNRLYGLSIIHACERIHANDRCLLSSANDGEGRCVLYG